MSVGERSAPIDKYLGVYVLIFCSADLEDDLSLVSTVSPHSKLRPRRGLLL